MKIGCYECHGREGQGAAATGPRLGPNPIAYNRFIALYRKPTGDMLPIQPKSLPISRPGYIRNLQSLPRPPAADSIPLLK